jgi:hypothetical protein
MIRLGRVEEGGLEGSARDGALLRSADTNVIEEGLTRFGVIDTLFVAPIYG